MPKNIVSVEIKKIPLDIETKELGYVELTDLAAKVEQKMQQLQEDDGVIDTLKQALLAAMSFAAEAYLNQQNEGGKRKEEEARLDEMLMRLQSSVEMSKKLTAIK